MKRMILFFIMLFVIISCTKEIKVTNFDECAKAGNPILESYPRQCTANGESFTEVINVLYDKVECKSDEWRCSYTQECIKRGEICNNGLVGGDIDEHGCKPSTGYTWCEEEQTCVREWEEPCTSTAVANPASEYCLKEKGEWKMVESSQGTVGYCMLLDGRICEEWIYFRSDGEECDELVE